MNLVAGVIYYDDLKSLQRLIPTIIDGVDHIIAVDGKFSLREGKDYSTDGSTEYLKSFDKVILKKFTGMEHDKRNIYMEEAVKIKADAVFVIDTDEYVFDADWDKLKQNIKGHDYFLGINFRYNEKDFTPYPRIFTKPHEMRYWKTHNIMSLNGNLQRINSKNMVDGISMSGDDALREPDWIDKTFEYQKKMIKYEIPFRRQIG